MHPSRSAPSPASTAAPSSSHSALARQDHPHRQHRPPLALSPLPPLSPILDHSTSTSANGHSPDTDPDEDDLHLDNHQHVLLDACPSPVSTSRGAQHPFGHGRSDSGSCCRHSLMTTRRRPEERQTSPASGSMSCASTTLLNRPPPPPPLPNPPLPVAFRSWFKHLRRAPLATLSHTLSLWPLCRSRQDFALFALSWIYFSLCSYITCLANSTVDRYNPNNVVPIDQRTVLMDPGMQTLASAYATYIHGPRDVSDWFVRLCSVLILTRAVLHRERAATVLRRACYVGGTLYLLRSQTVLMTVLPNPLLECETKPHPNVWYDAYLLFTQQRASCGDVFFSGHSIIFMTNLNVWWVFGRNWAAKFAAMLTSILAVISLLASSYHYSIDVWTACILCLTTFFLYQWTATGQIGHGTWWGNLIQLIDGDERFRAQACLAAPTSASASPCILPSSHHAITAKLDANKPACASCAGWWDHYDTRSDGAGGWRGVWWMPGSGSRLPRYQRVGDDVDHRRQDDDRDDLVSVVSASSSASSLANAAGGACRVAPAPAPAPRGLVRAKPTPARTGSPEDGAGVVSASAPPTHASAHPGGGINVPRRASLMAQRPGYPRLGAGAVAATASGVVGTAPVVGMSAAHLLRAQQASAHDEQEELDGHEEQSPMGSETSQVWRR